MNTRLVGGVATALASLALWPAVAWLVRRRRRFGRCVETRARVCRIDVDEGCKRLWYEFRDKSGQAVVSGSDYADRSLTDRVGDEVPVLYDPESPGWNEINRWMPKYGAPAAALALLAPWLIVGVLTLLFGGG